VSIISIRTLRAFLAVVAIGLAIVGPPVEVARAQSPDVTSEDGVALRLAESLTGNLLKVTASLRSVDVPRLREGSLAAGPVTSLFPSRVTVVARLLDVRRTVVLNGSYTFSVEKTGHVELWLTSAGRRLLRGADSFPLLVSVTMTLPSGVRVSGSRAIVLAGVYLTGCEIRPLALRAIREGFGDRPQRIALRRFTRLGPALVRTLVLWQHRGVWWYSRMRIRQTGSRFTYRMTNAYRW